MVVDREWLKAWSALYPDSYDRKHDIDAVRLPVSYDDVRRIIAWKSRRSLGYFVRNGDEAVVASITAALAEPDDVRALGLLCKLHGVRERVGSAILAVYNRDRYAVMDWRAYRSLVNNGELPELAGTGWRAAWPLYLLACRSIALRERLSLRDVDRALYEAKGATALPVDPGSTGGEGA